MEPYPVDDYLTVTDATDIYKTNKWWKAVVVYTAENQNDSETAVYLWLQDDGEWKTKNKYIVKTADAWEADTEVIDALLSGDYDGSESIDTDDSLPVSDYYTVGEAHHVFQTDEWWKAIVRVDKKGDYETTEVIVYLWQCDDNKWRQRQKYAIKQRDDWEEEYAVISEYVRSGGTGGSEPVKSATTLDKDLSKVRARAHLSTIGEDA
jgi:hypothetical protein